MTDPRRSSQAGIRLRIPMSQPPLQPEERRILGAELHDRLCQELSGLALRSAALVKAIPEGGPCSKEAKALSRGYARARHMSNELVAGLMPVPVDGLAANLRSLAGRLRRRYGIPFGFSGKEIPIDGETAAHVYRIAQEAARNSIRHGSPGRVRITLGRNADGRNQLRVSDDGMGLEPRGARKGFGISIMRFRARLIGGELNIRSSPGAGCAVTCAWPADKARS